MNAVEIEEAISQLAEAPFDLEEFPFTFLEGWNTFSVPTITELNKADLTDCTEETLLERALFPATIANKTCMPPDRMDSEFLLLRADHDCNDEVLERIYIGHRFKDDTERLEKLFEMYTKMNR